MLKFSSLCVLVTGLAACSDDRGFELGAIGSLVVEPTSVEIVIGETARDAESMALVHLSNTGSATVKVRSMKLEPAGSATAGLPEAVYVVAVPMPLAVEPTGSPRLIELVYHRVDDRPRALVLVLESSDPLAPIVRVPVNVVAGVPHLVVHPTPVVFQRSDQPESQTVRLLNLGNAPLHVSEVVLTAPADFAAHVDGVELGPQTSTLATFAPPITVEPGNEHTLTVEFDALGTNPVTGQLVVFGDSVNSQSGFTIELRGNEGGPCLLTRPSALGFGTKSPGDIVELPLELENCGTEPVDVTSVRLATASDAADATLHALGAIATSERFELVSDVAPSDAHPLRLAPGASVRLAVRYFAWEETTLTELDGVRGDEGAVVVVSSAYVPVQIVPLHAGTEHTIVDVPDDPVVPDVPSVPGCEWQGGQVTNHHVAITLTADNYYELWVNDDLIATDTGNWATEDRFEFDLVSGCHVIGVHAWGDGAVTAGMIAAIEIDGVVRWTTGDAKPEWSVAGPNAPQGDWHDLFYDDSAWADPRACTRISQWGTAVDPLLAMGASWVWWNPECDDQLATAWFRLTFTVD